MVNHAVRDHASWSASATERNWNCPGALALTIDLPEKTSEAADWGTVCHEVSEICLREGKQPADFIGQTRKGKSHSFEVDDEMAETAEVYVSYVRQSAIEAAPKNVNPSSLLQIEQKFSLESLNPPFDAGGTGDAVIYYPALKKLKVVDLKGGRGKVVEVKSNPQLRTYGLGAMLANPDLEVTTIEVVIVQPRAGHRDGRIRSEEFHVADLVEWTMELMVAMRRSAEAMGTYAAFHPKKAPRDVIHVYETYPEVLSDAEWNAKYLTPGDHCAGTFCKAQGFCPALQQRALDAAGVWFDDLDQPRLSNAPDALSPEQAAQMLDAADMIEGWINAVRAFWHDQAESGVEIPNYVLVPKTGREKWKEGTESAAAELALNAGVDEDKIYNAPKIRTPKQVRDALAKLKKPGVLDEIKSYSFTPENGTNLVRATKTTRAPVAAAVNRHFDILD